MGQSWKKSFYAIWAAEVLAIAGFGTSQPILPFYLQDLGVTDPTALKYWNGIINSAGSLALAIMAPIWGRLADSYGRRLMLLRAMFGGTVIIFLMGFSANPSQLLVLKTLQGAVTGTIAAATVLVATIVPAEQTGFSLGLLQTGVFVGSSAGPLIGGLIADYFGTRATFFVTAALLLVAGVIVLYMVEEHFTATKPARFRLREALPDFKPLFESRELATLLLLVGVVQIANSVVVPILPLFIQDLAPSAERIGSVTGLILGVSALTAACSAAVIGKLSYRWGYGRTIFVAVAGATLLCVPQAFVQTPMELLIFRTLGAIFLGAIGPVSNALIAMKTTPEKRGSIFGLNTSISALGIALGPAIGAGVAATSGYKAVFLTTAGLLAGTTVLMAAFLRRRARVPS